MRRGEIVSRLTRALELWQDGDTLAAIQVVEDLRRELLQVGHTRRPYRCSCGERFEFPGELDDHQRRSCRRLWLRSRWVA